MFDSDLLDEQLERLLVNDDVRRAMALRCEEEGHQYRNGISVSFVLTNICRWCGDRQMSTQGGF